MIRYIIRSMLYRLRGEYTTEKLIKMGMKVGKNFARLHGVILDPAHCWLIEIGDNVTMAPRVHILAHDASTVRSLGYAKIGRVKIGNNVFIGAETVVLPNVKIGDNVIVGANSTVTHDLENDAVYVGNPAIKISTMKDYLDKNKKLMETCPCFSEEYTLRENISEQKKEIMNKKLDDSIGFIR